MGSICSRDGFKYNCSGGREGGEEEEEEEEEKRVLCFAYEPRRLNQDFVVASHGTKKDDNKNRNWIRIISVQEKEKEKRGIMIFISIFIFILVREVTPRRVIEWRSEENEKDSNSSSSYSYSLCDELQLLIMSKVPFHSLVKFRRVSKTWRSWISKEHFFIGKSPLRTDGIFFTGRNGFTYIPLPDNDNDEEDRSTIAVTVRTSSLPFPTVDDGGGGLSFDVFRHAFNGLLLLSTFRDRVFELLVHNPFTRQSVLLPLSSQEFFGPLWIGYEPCRFPYFYVVRAVFMSGSTSLMLQIFSSGTWTWRNLVTDLRPITSPRRDSGRAVTNDGFMFIDLTFICSIILIVDLHTSMDYLIVPLPPGLPPRLKDAWSALGMCEDNIMYAYSQSGILLVYKLLRLKQGGDYLWTLLIEDRSLQYRLASKLGMAPTYHSEARDFLLHVPVLLISSTCSVTRRCKVLSYNFTNGSILELFESKSRIHSITPLSICPLEIYSGDSSF